LASMHLDIHPSLNFGLKARFPVSYEFGN
jgi:hypothetical protein